MGWKEMKSWVREQRRANKTTFEKVSETYRTYADKYAERLAEYRVWAWFAKTLAQDPKKLALGVAEGIILSKLTFPIYGTIGFYISMRCYQRREEDISEEPMMRRHSQKLLDIEGALTSKNDVVEE